MSTQSDVDFQSARPNNRNASHIALYAQDHISVPPIFVLNLDRAQERWERVKEEVVKQGLEVTRLPAVDGKNLPSSTLAKETTMLARMFQPKGVLGCYLSHRKFWQLVVDSNLTEAIVFEDDIQLVDNFREKLLENLRDLNRSEKFDVILLGAIGRVHPDGKDSYSSRIFSSYIGGNRHLKRISASLYEPIRPAGTHAYMVSREGAQKLLSLCPKATYHVDLDAWRHKSLVLRMFDPMLVYQTFEDTTLTDVKNLDALNRLSTHASWKHVRRINKWSEDPITKQPWSHVLAEPLLQLSPVGPVLTVQRYCTIVFSCIVVSGVCELFGRHGIAKTMIQGMVSFAVTVRALIWLLMNWK
eukprot:gene431-464_t